MPNQQNVFSWEGETVFIPQEIIEKIIRAFTKNSSVLNQTLVVAEKEGDDVTAIDVLMPFGKKLAFIVSCLKSSIGQHQERQAFFLATDGSGSIVLAKSFRGLKGYFISKLSGNVPRTTTPTSGTPKIVYKSHLPNKVKDVMDGFFSDGMRELTEQIDGAIVQECTVKQITDETNLNRYLVFGYLIRRLLCEKTAQYRIKGRSVLWRKK